MSTINSWGNTVSDAAVTLNGGVVNINSSTASDSVGIGIGTTARTVGICNSAAAHLLTLGSSNTSASTTIQYGSAGLSLTGGSGGQSTAFFSSGKILTPLQPMFCAYLNASTTNNKTGTGTQYVVLFNTELFDIGNNYNNTTGVFTAPVSGKYMFTSAIEVTNLGAHTSAELLISSTPKLFGCMHLNPVTAKVGTTLGLTGTVVVNLTAGNTVVSSVAVGGSTFTVGVLGSSSALTFFGGFLIA